MVGYFVCMILVILYSLLRISVFHVWSLSLDYILLIIAITLVPFIILSAFQTAQCCLKSQVSLFCIKENHSPFPKLIWILFYQYLFVINRFERSLQFFLQFIYELSQVSISRTAQNTNT